VLSAQNLTFAEKTLLDQPGWKNGMDGRASKAMLRLLLSLRELRLAHSDLAVAAFDITYKPGDEPGARDEAMGHELFTLGETYPGA